MLYYGRLSIPKMMLVLSCYEEAEQFFTRAHKARNTKKNKEMRGYATMIKILFICHGNICRSPISEFVMKDMVTKRGIKAKFYIASAATSTEEIWNGIGNPVYPPAKRELAKHGISYEGKRAVQITKADYGKYDYILGMEERNIRNILRIVGKDPEGKVKLLLDYSDNPRDIADPWYTRDFESTYRDVVEGCEGFLAYLEKNEKI